MNFEAMIDRVASVSDRQRGTTAAGLIADSLTRTPRSERVAMLRNKIAIAAMRYTTDPAAFHIDQPLVEAFVRVHHHPRPPHPMPVVDPQAPRLLQIVTEHPDLEWDSDRIQSLLVQAVRERVKGTMRETSTPWLMPWGEAAAAAHVLFECSHEAHPVTVAVDVRIKTFHQAIEDVVIGAMDDDPRILVIGEDVRLFHSEIHGRFGNDRVLNAPISEGSGGGAGSTGEMTG